MFIARTARVASRSAFRVAPVARWQAPATFAGRSFATKKGGKAAAPQKSAEELKEEAEFLSHLPKDVVDKARAAAAAGKSTAEVLNMLRATFPEVAQEGEEFEYDEVLDGSKGKFSFPRYKDTVREAEDKLYESRKGMSQDQLIEQADKQWKAVEAEGGKDGWTRPKDGRERLQLYGDVGKLAHNLLNAALENKSDLNAVSKGMADFAVAMEEKPDLAENVLTTGLMTIPERIFFLGEVVFPAMEKSGTPVDKLAQGMLMHMIDAGHVDSLEQLREVQGAFDELVRDEHNEVLGRVTTAEPLQPGHLKSISKKLESLLQKGQKLVLETKVDPKLLGGLVVELGDKAQDLSTRAALDDFEGALRSHVLGEGDA